MKRIIAIFLCLCLSLGTVAAYAAEKTSANFYLTSNTENSSDETKYISNAINVGDTIYVLTNRTLERWTPGDAEPTVVLKDFDMPENIDEETAIKDDQAGKVGISKLFADDTTLYGLNRVTGTVWKLADANGPLTTPELAVKLEWDKMRRKDSQNDDYAYTPQMGDTALINGVLYTTITDWNSSTQSYELASWTFSTGKLLEDKANLFMRTLSAYKDGLIIGKYYDEANSWDQKTQTQKMPSLATYNPATGEVTTLFDFDDSNVYSIRYSAANDTLYYMGGSTLYSMVGLQKPAKISAYLPNAVWDDTSMMMLPSGMVAIADYNGLVIRGIDLPGIEKGALTIYGDYGSSGHQAYLAAYPQALVTCSQDYYNSLEQFTNAMVSGNGAMDVLRLDSDYSPLTRLIDKGYALDLSAYPDLVAVANAMDPNLTKIGMKDGKLYGIPVDITANSFGYNEGALETLGLTVADVPTNFMALLDFVANWQDDYGEDHPDMMLFDSGSVKQTLLDWLMTDYVAYLTKQGQPISFDTDLFRKLMEKLDSIDYTDLDAPQDSTEKDAYYNKTGVFTMYANVTYPGYYREEQKFVALPLDEGMDPVFPAMVQVMIINPRTTHLEQAVQYLTTYVQNIDPTSAKITLTPGNNEPVINSNFENDLNNWKKIVADETETLKTANPEDKPSIQSDIEYVQGLIDNSESYRYTVSAEAIATYREQIAPYLVVVGQNPLNTWSDDGNNEFSTLENQYMQGAITADAFIKEIDKRIRMMQLEDQ